nr:hypothetical protein [Tanacetum cinerariifolium]
ITSYGYWLWIISSGWSYVSTVLGQMTYPVTSLTLNSASCIAIVGVVIAIIGVVVVVGGVFIIKLLFVIIVTFPLMLIGWAYAFHQDKASSVRVPVANVTLFALAQLIRENTDSVRSNQRMSPTAPSVPLK